MRIRPGMSAIWASAAVTAAILAGCGGSSGNGVASKSADAIVKAANDAVTHATSVHVSGSITASGTPLNLDLALVAGKGGRGQVSEGGILFRLVNVGQTVYLYGTPAFWQRYAGAAAEQKINGRWVKAPASGSLNSLAALTNMQRLMSSLLLSHGTLTKGPTKTVNGHQAVEVNDTSQGGTAYYVATTGPPYPIEITRQGTNSIRIVFDRFNQPVSLTPPANSVDLSQLG